MHELSIANQIVEIVRECATKAGAKQVTSVTLRIGALACIHESPLRWAFEIAASGTLLEGADLQIIAVPLAVFCENCRETFELPGIQHLACPHCGAPSGDIRAGNELDVETVTIVEDVPETSPSDEPEKSRDAG